MAREMFNPNLALFVTVPDGGSTFQPNPNSHVQNDRGISHLDYFRCVRTAPVRCTALQYTQWGGKGAYRCCP